MDELTVKFPRPRAIAYTISNETYALAVRMWTMSAPDDLVASTLGCAPAFLPAITSSEEWIEAARMQHQQFEAQMEAEHSRLIARGLREIEDRLIHGDIVVDKFGFERRAKAKMKDCAATVRLLFENRKEFQRMAAGQIDPQQTHAEALMRIANALTRHRAFNDSTVREVIDIEDEKAPRVTPARKEFDSMMRQLQQTPAIDVVQEPTRG